MFTKGEIFMKTKKTQNFDLLESIRCNAQIGLTRIQDVILQAPDKTVHISETLVESKVLEDLKVLLEKVQSAKTIGAVRMILSERSVPVELVVADQFWGDFQELIKEMHKKEIER